MSNKDNSTSINKKVFDSKKYFIYAFKRHILNENKILYKKFLPSIREVLLDYIDIYDDVNQNIENKKLQNAKKDIIKSTIFLVKESIFYTQGIYKEELDLLINDMKKIESNLLNSLEEARTYNKCKSVIKKISNDNLYSHLGNIIKNLNNFAEVDRCIECMISEMLYDGYSLKYIENWYNFNISKELAELNEINIDIIIDKYKEFSIKEKEYKYYLTIKTMRILDENIYLDYNLVMKKEIFEDITLHNVQDNKDAKNYLNYGGNTYLYTVVLKCRDYYKGLEILIDSLNSYIQMVNYLDENNELTINDKIVVKIDEGKYEKLRKQIYDDVILFDKSQFIEMFGNPSINDKGWMIDKLSTVVTNIENGKSFICESFSRSGKYPAILKLSAVTYGIYNANENKALTDESLYVSSVEVKSEDLLFTRKNTPELVGMSAYVYNTEPNLMMPDLIFRFNTNENINKIYLWKLINHDLFREKIKSLSNGSAKSMSNISKQRLMELNIPIPPIELQKQFADFVKQTDKLKFEMEKSLKELEDNFNALMQKAFNGELFN